MTATTTTTAGAQLSTAIESGIIQDITEGLNSDPESVELYEGAITGHLYVDVGSDMHTFEMGPDGLTTNVVDEPTEELEEVASVRPDPGEPVEDALDAIVFVGD